MHMLVPYKQTRKHIYAHAYVHVCSVQIGHVYRSQSGSICLVVQACMRALAPGDTCVMAARPLHTRSWVLWNDLIKTAKFTQQHFSVADVGGFWLDLSERVGQLCKDHRLHDRKRRASTPAPSLHGSDTVSAVQPHMPHQLQLVPDTMILIVSF